VSEDSAWRGDSMAARKCKVESFSHAITANRCDHWLMRFIDLFQETLAAPGKSVRLDRCQSRQLGDLGA
jgi:hypothetical protein